mmetsp:Transcript_49561/g.96949  ORF Transcript_49561/g.96949 Transcript_49561/m.96949 type:complete len:311 (-) Transcript_49561:1655-2587(-)
MRGVIWDASVYGEGGVERPGGRTGVPPGGDGFQWCVRGNGRVGHREGGYAGLHLLPTRSLGIGHERCWLYVLQQGAGGERGLRGVHRNHTHQGHVQCHESEHVQRAAGRSSIYCKYCHQQSDRRGDREAHHCRGPGGDDDRLQIHHHRARLRPRPRHPQAHGRRHRRRPARARHHRPLRCPSPRRPPPGTHARGAGGGGRAPRPRCANGRHQRGVSQDRPGAGAGRQRHRPPVGDGGHGGAGGVESKEDGGHEEESGGGDRGGGQPALRGAQHLPDPGGCRCNPQTNTGTVAGSRRAERPRGRRHRRGQQ